MKIEEQLARTVLLLQIDLGIDESPLILRALTDTVVVLAQPPASITVTV